jgi:hypothetical protein
MRAITPLRDATPLSDGITEEQARPMMPGWLGGPGGGTHVGGW